MVKPAIYIALLGFAVYLSIQVLSALFTFVTAVLVPAAILAAVLFVGIRMVGTRDSVVLRGKDNRDIDQNR